ncbi:CHL4-domain-containing protein [Lindgomyces ingoldianus]|uniref:CHL4-domain-containing protein n=1 Tax=Lindgomyces ingoldianus TaxID=673940 RepID=A0ACB6QJM0_9PLEO|nr:CHL4-domain-containing protein [Lindgomyces ingoldianus]KAF2467133.1 CHL4-domain-containing protein [Lindgomyces ingoldianus]
MAPSIPVTVPDYKNVPHSYKLPVAHREVVRTFSKLSRLSLISLVHQWLTKKNREFCRPYLKADEDPNEKDRQVYEPAESYEDLQDIYKELAARKGGRKEVVDRILEGDWRNGISMFQLATAEVHHLLEHPGALRWNARRLTKIRNPRLLETDMEVTNESEHLPRFQAQTFMMNLAKELLPLMKAHLFITRVKTLPMTILRVYMHDSPYSTEASLAMDTSGPDGAKAVFFIWPNGSPFVFVSLSTHLGQAVGDEGRHLRDVVDQAIPKAFSRPSARYQLLGTNFSARTLTALLTYRGPGKTNAAAGGWSIFADHSFNQSVLDYITAPRPSQEKKRASDKESAAEAVKPGPGRPKRVVDEMETLKVKRRRKIAEGRFGSSAKLGDGQGVERFEVRIDDPFPTISNSNGLQRDHNISEISNAPAGRRSRRGRPPLLDRSTEDMEDTRNEDDGLWIPDVRLTFSGTHVFAGIRQLVEGGAIDGEKMPGWMTGEAGVTLGSVKSGRMRTKGEIQGV